jgi:hypothetical protein
MRPWVVRISAPAGSDSNFNAWSCSDEEFDDSAEEQPVSESEKLVERHWQWLAGTCC